MSQQFSIYEYAYKLSLPFQTLLHLILLYIVHSVPYLFIQSEDNSDYS